jgi:hypothetical protein
MSDKKLLNESTIRRFMTLAAIQPLSNTFIKEQVPEPPAPEEEEAGASLEGEEAMSVDPDVEDLSDELGAEEPPEDGTTVSDEEADVLIALGQRLESELEEVEPEEEELGDEEFGGEEVVAGEEPVEGAPDEELEALAEILNNSNLEIFSERDERGLVNEVFKRVTKRIISERLR